MTEVLEQNKINQVLEPIELSTAGPRVDFGVFHPAEFPPNKQAIAGLDAILIISGNCGADNQGVAAASNGDVGTIVCDHCLAHAARGFGSNPQPLCPRPPKLVRLKPQSTWSDPPSAMTVIAYDVDGWTAAFAALK